MATTLSVLVFYAICQRDLYPDWKKRIRNLPMMISVGVGMCLSNGKAVLQGCIGRRLVFHRTPKYSVYAGDASWKQKIYRSGNSLAFLVEGFFACYFLVATGVAFRLHQWGSLPFIALFCFGYSYVALLTAMHAASWHGWPLLGISRKNLDE